MLIKATISIQAPSGKYLNNKLFKKVEDASIWIESQKTREDYHSSKMKRISSDKIFPLNKSGVLRVLIKINNKMEEHDVFKWSKSQSKWGIVMFNELDLTQRSYRIRR